MSMEGDAIRSVQSCEHREVAELRGDGAIELIRAKVPEGAAMRTIEDASYSNRDLKKKSKHKTQFHPLESDVNGG